MHTNNWEAMLMRILIVSALMLMLMLLPGCSKGASLVSSCPSTYDALKTIAPKIPIKTDSQFQGLVKVMLTIDEAGNVSHAAVTTIDLHQLDRGGTDPVGYDQAVLTAVKGWKFPKSSVGCTKEVTFNLSRNES